MRCDYIAFVYCAVSHNSQRHVDIGLLQAHVLNLKLAYLKWARSIFIPGCRGVTRHGYFAVTAPTLAIRLCLQRPDCRLSRESFVPCFADSTFFPVRIQHTGTPLRLMSCRHDLHVFSS